MSDTEQDKTEFEVDIADQLGAEEGVSHQVLTLYIPDKDRYGNEIGTQRKWILEAAQLLAAMGVGLPSCHRPKAGGLMKKTM